LKPITGSDLCRLLEAGGWTLHRIAGSHYIYTKPGERKTLSIPVHGNRNLKPGLAGRLAREANLWW
jgi:predicted RNA binding protein YcfA (HicA-like mRNA interferase family)